MPKTYGISNNTKINETKFSKEVVEVGEKFKRKKYVEPDGGWGWLVVFGVALTTMTSQSLLSVFSLLFSQRLEELNIDTKGAAAILSMQTTSLNLSGLLTGIMIKKFAYRGTALLGSFFVVSGLLMTTYSNSLTAFIFTYGLPTGLGLGFIISSTFVAINEYFTDHKGLAVSLAMTGSGIGQMTMPILIRYLLSEYGFRGTMLILASIAAHSFIGCCLYHPVKWHLKLQEVDEEKILLEKKEKNLRTPTDESCLPKFQTKEKKTQKEIIKEKDNEEEDGKKDGVVARIIRAMDWDLMRNASFVNLIVCIAVVYSGNVCFAMLYPFYLEYEVGFELLNVAFCMSALSAGDIVGRLVVHVFTDNLKLKSKTVMFTGAVLSGLARSAVAFQHDFYTILFMAVGVGLVRSAIVCNFQLAVSQQTTKEKLPSAIGLHMVIKGIAVMSFGPLIGFIRDSTQSYSLCIHIVSVFFLGLPFLAWLLEEIITKRVKR